VITVVSVIYLVIALGYPAGAGTLPAIIAAIAAAVALFRLASWAVRGVASTRSARTAGAAGAGPATADVPAAMAAAPARYAAESGGGLESQHDPFGQSDLAEPTTAGHPDPARPEHGPPEPEQPVPERRRRRAVRELTALGWIWAAVAAAYLFGFEVGVPVVAAAYCLTSVEWSRRWQRLAYAAAVTGITFAIAYGFVSLFSLTFSGVLA
jgi:hypothetical protein